MYNNYIQKIKKSRKSYFKVARPINNFFCLYSIFFFFIIPFVRFFNNFAISIILYKLLKVNVYLQLRAFEKHQKTKKALILLLKSFKKIFSLFLFPLFSSHLYLQFIHFLFVLTILFLFFPSSLFFSSKEIHDMFLLIRLLIYIKFCDPFRLLPNPLKIGISATPNFQKKLHFLKCSRYFFYSR